MSFVKVDFPLKILQWFFTATMCGYRKNHVVVKMLLYELLLKLEEPDRQDVECLQ